MKYMGGVIKFCIRSNWSSDPISEVIFNSDKKYFNEIYEVNKIIDQIVNNKHSAIKYNNCFIDIGANIGPWSCVFASKGWNVYAIEASNENIELLENTTKLNDFPITICPYILYDKTGKMYFYQRGPYGMCSSTNDAVHNVFFSDVNPYEMDAICLDDWKDTYLSSVKNVDFIKIDIEGSEVAAMRGAHKFLEYFNYPIIFCESNKWTMYIQSETVLSLRNEMKSMGYKTCQIFNGTVYFLPDDWYQKTVCEDFLFIHESDVPNVDIRTMPNQNDDEIELSILDSLKTGDGAIIFGTLYDLIKSPNTSCFVEKQDIKNEIAKIKETYKDNIMFNEIFKLL